MIDFNVDIGFIKQTKQQKEEIYTPFYLDISKFPSLFIDCNNTNVQDLISHRIKIKSGCFTQKDRVKRVIIDDYIVTETSMFEPGKYSWRRPDTMLKRINSIATKIYEDYKNNPNFFPHTKYIIVVNGIQGLEQHILNLLPKLGPIGMYLTIVDDSQKIEAYQDICSQIYGKITYCVNKDIELNDKTETDYPIGFEKQEHVCILERFRLQQEQYPVIYPRTFYNDFEELTHFSKLWAKTMSKHNKKDLYSHD